jgi:leucyl-tRNA synthetase/ADP-ribose pyrophosphatase YjhB (NUDIX family)
MSYLNLSLAPTLYSLYTRAMQRYNPKDIEPKWQSAWAVNNVHQALNDSDKPKKYILEFFPYPSGASMHVGHVRNYSIGDALSRFYRMQGFNVLHPMGWDAFGLPAENYAIKIGISPAKAVADNVENFKAQLTQMGFGYDWSREINSTTPDYYKWTQKFFLLLNERNLAYRKESLQWWCEKCKTVLANEQVVDGKCWRHDGADDVKIGKKALPQWFFKITDYADRLAEDLDKVDWSDSLKSMQRNWIGKSRGAEVDFKIAQDERHPGEGRDPSIQSEKITVFTTRPDTIYGATFMVLAPEHPFLETIVTAEQKAEVEAYQKSTLEKSEVERQEEADKEKTGVFTGAYAINPVNNEQVPIWISDYVLMGYGTGAIMAVPAHDERDLQFANKFNIPVVPVIAQDFGDSHENEVEVRGVVVIGYDRKTKKYLGLRNPSGSAWLCGGGIEEGETFEQCAVRELKEETGYDSLEMIQLGSPVYSHYYNEKKDSYRRSFAYAYLAVVDSTQELKSAKEAHEDFQNEWFEWQPLFKDIVKTGGGVEHWLAMLERAQKTVGHMLEMLERAKNIAENEAASDEMLFEGVMFNSVGFNGLTSFEAREKITKHLVKIGAGREKVQYKIRDWLISRQRYWGAPIPMIHCPKDGAVPVPEKDLPVVLPELVKYEPSGDGRSPLANVEDWVNVECPKCGGPAERETDTMDGFACSSWYFSRFADPKNDKVAFSREAVDYWLPVDLYIGGAEHAVMHLLYARMWTKVMFDAGIIGFDEPFTSLKNQGMIMAPDGQKMSKSKGNTITPTELLEDGYGADSIRLMELFIGPWNQSAAWSTEGLGGCYRFIQRIWKLVEEYKGVGVNEQNSKSVSLRAPTRNPEKPDEHNNWVPDQARDDNSLAPSAYSLLSTELQRERHKTIQKVTSDMYDMGFNTAIARLMEFVNSLYKFAATDKTFGGKGSETYKLWNDTLIDLVKLIAPFAPHAADELWHELTGEPEDKTVHQSTWPTYDENLAKDEQINIAVQVNGKLRTVLTVSPDITEEEITKLALDDEKVKVYVPTSPKKVIYVKGRMLSVVV